MENVCSALASPTTTNEKYFSCFIDELSCMQRSQHMHQACQAYGFFYIRGVPTYNNLFDEARDYFSLPLKDKVKFISTRANQHLGYRAAGSEKSVLTQVYEQCEQFKFGYFHDTDKKTSRLLLDGYSLYPNTFRGATLGFFHHMQTLATQILSVIGNNLSLGPNYFEQFCHEPCHQLGLNYYPLSKHEHQTSQNYAMSAHRDLCLITIIAQTKAGISICDREDKWHTIPQQSDTLLVLVGDYLERWTNDLYLAPTHQVHASSDTARMSVIYKHRPSYDTTIPAITGINPNRQDYPHTGFHTGKAYERKINNIMQTTEE